MRYIFVLTIFTLSTLGLVIACDRAAPQITNKVAVKNNAPAAAPSAPAHDQGGEQEAKRISLADAKAAYDAGKAVIIDSRVATAYQAEHIKGAINIPVDETEKRIGELPKNKQLI